MIKLGKMQLNSNISYRGYLTITLFSLLLTCIFSVLAITNYIKTKEYDKFDATITYIGTKYTGSNSEESTINYIKFKFEYNNKEYSNEQRVAFKFNKKIGDRITVYVNSNNPNEIKDTYYTNSANSACFMMIVITIFLIKACIIKKRE